MSKIKNKTKFKYRKKKTMKKKINNRNRNRNMNTKLRNMKGGALSPLAQLVMKKATTMNPSKIAGMAGMADKLMQDSTTPKLSAGIEGVDPKVAEIIKHYEEQEELKKKLQQGSIPGSSKLAQFAASSAGQKFALGMANKYSSTAFEIANKFGAKTPSFIKDLSTQPGLPSGFGKKLASSLSSAPIKTTGLGGPVSGFNMPMKNKLSSSSFSFKKFKP